MSFRHVVLFTFTAEATGEQRRAVLDGLAALPSQIPEIRGFRFGVDAGLAEGNADVAVVADFDDRAAYQTYARHPAHQALVAERIRPILAARAAAQHEVT